MAKLTKLLGGTALAVLGATTASAGGMEVGRFDPGFLYETGNYAEVSYSSRSPDVTDSLYAPNSSMLSDFTTLNGALKLQLTDKIAVGLTSYDAGRIALDYSETGGPAPTNASLTMRSTAIVAKYDVTDAIDVYGGIKMTTAEAEAFFLHPDDLPGTISADSGNATGGLVGVSYSRSDIALRVALTYQEAIETTHTTTYNGGPFVDSVTGTPEMLTLDFQTGIAQGTLLFGSISNAKWFESQVYVAGQQLSTFTDSTSYSLGVGRKLNDNWSISGSVNYEAATGDDSTTLLDTTDGNQGVSLGVRYTRDNMTVSVGANYSKFGDKTYVGDTPSPLDNGVFADNSIMTYGMKVGFSF